MWNTEKKEWIVKYRPYRNHWIVLLLTVNKRLFSLPLPKIVPDQIKAQFQQEEDFQNNKQMQLTAVKNTRKSLGLSIITADVCSPQIKK